MSQARYLLATEHVKEGEQLQSVSWTPFDEPMEELLETGPVTAAVSTTGTNDVQQKWGNWPDQSKFPSREQRNGSSHPIAPQRKDLWARAHSPIQEEHQQLAVEPSTQWDQGQGLSPPSWDEKSFCPYNQAQIPQQRLHKQHQQQQPSLSIAQHQQVEQRLPSQEQSLAYSHFSFPSTASSTVGTYMSHMSPNEGQQLQDQKQASDRPNVTSLEGNVDTGGENHVAFRDIQPAITMSPQQDTSPLPLLEQQIHQVAATGNTWDVPKPPTPAQDGPTTHTLLRPKQKSFDSMEEADNTTVGEFTLPPESESEQKDDDTLNTAETDGSWTKRMRARQALLASGSWGAGRRSPESVEARLEPESPNSQGKSGTPTKWIAEDSGNIEEENMSIDSASHSPTTGHGRDREEMKRKDMRSQTRRVDRSHTGYNRGRGKEADLVSGSQGDGFFLNQADVLHFQKKMDKPIIKVAVGTTIAVGLGGE